MNPNYAHHHDALTEPLTQLYLGDEEVELFNLSCPDDKLNYMLIDELEKDHDYWKKAPWSLEDTDIKNTAYLLGDQQDSKEFIRNDNRYVDNRLFSSYRAILSYATGQLAVPEITPSRSDSQYLAMARRIQSALYQHSLDEQVEQKTRAAVGNLVVRKRGFLKLRFDPNAGMYGDIVTEVCSPEDITINRFAGYMSNPNKIYHRLRCSVDELCAKFPKKEKDIRIAYSIKQGRYTQMSRQVTYFECWFTYLDTNNVPKEGVCWFIPEHSLILDKMPNPNWVYTGDDMEDKKTNVTFRPPKPFIGFNYLNTGHAYIDETCLFEQARPQQELLNTRSRQFNQNVDYMNGRWVASKKAFNEEDAQKLVNKGARTVAMTNAEDSRMALNVVTPNPLPTQVYQSIEDLRSEIDTMMGTPAIFRGAQPESQNTLGRDLQVKQQAGMLQDDLVRAVATGMETYYKIKLQMMRVYYTDDYWFAVKGGDGKFDFIMLNGDSIDANVKVGVQVDSTLPLDKQMIRTTAMQLAGMKLIDPLTLIEDLGLPEPEIRVDRLLKSQMDPLDYMKSVEQDMDNNDAEVDIMLLIDGKQPEERDNYDQDYLNYFNNFITQNRFNMLPDDAKKRVVSYLMVTQHLATQSANLQAQTQSEPLNQAGMIEGPIPMPVPKRTEQIRISGNIDPATSQQIAQPGSPPPATPPQAPQI